MRLSGDAADVPAGEVAIEVTFAAEKIAHVGDRGDVPVFHVLRCAVDLIMTAVVERGDECRFVRAHAAAAGRRRAAAHEDDLCGARATLGRTGRAAQQVVDQRAVVIDIPCAIGE